MRKAVFKTSYFRASSTHLAQDVSRCISGVELVPLLPASKRQASSAAVLRQDAPSTAPLDIPLLSIPYGEKRKTAGLPRSREFLPSASREISQVQTTSSPNSVPAKPPKTNSQKALRRSREDIATLITSLDSATWNILYLSRPPPSYELARLKELADALKTLSGTFIAREDLRWAVSGIKTLLYYGAERRGDAFTQWEGAEFRWLRQACRFKEMREKMFNHEAMVALQSLVPSGEGFPGVQIYMRLCM